MLNQYQSDIGLMQYDADVENVLKYLAEHQHGYMRDLEKLNKPEIISKLMSIGFLKSGFASKCATYSITPFGLRYYNVIVSPKHRFLHQSVNSGRNK